MLNKEEKKRLSELMRQEIKTNNIEEEKTIRDEIKKLSKLNKERILADKLENMKKRRI